MIITRCNNCMSIYEEAVDKCIHSDTNDFLMDIELAS
jgi:hypothetical protein